MNDGIKGSQVIACNIKYCQKPTAWEFLQLGQHILTVHNTHTHTSFTHCTCCLQSSLSSLMEKWISLSSLLTLREMPLTGRAPGTHHNSGCGQCYIKHWWSPNSSWEFAVCNYGFLGDSSFVPKCCKIAWDSIPSDCLCMFHLLLEMAIQFRGEKKTWDRVYQGLSEAPSVLCIADNSFADT
jgi:hypothetical protein